MLGFFILILPLLIILASEYPVFFYMVCLTVTTNIGGYFGEIPFLGKINLQDASFILSFSILFSRKINTKRMYTDQGFRKLILYLIGLSLYTIIIALFTISGNSLFFSSYTILNWRWVFFGFLAFIPGYLIAGNSKLIVQISIWVSLFILFMFVVTITTNLMLIPVEKASREIEGVNAGRVTFAGHMSYLFLIIWIGFLLLVLKIKMKNKLPILLIASLMLISQVLSLGRGINIFLFGSLFAVLIYVRKYFHLQVGLLIRKTSIFIFLTTLILFIFFPEYITAYYMTFFQSFLEMIGVIPIGTTQSRSTYELANQLPLIRQNPFFGTGITPMWFENKEFAGNISDLPIVTVLAMFGTVGTILYFYSYFIIFRRMKQFYKNMGNYFKIFLVTNKFDVILLLSLFVYFFSMVCFRLFNTGVEFIADYAKIEFYFFIGLMYGLMRKLEIQKFNQLDLSSKKATETKIESTH